VSPEGPASRAGISAGDRIVAVDTVPIATKSREFGWYIAFSNFEAGRPVLIEVERQGKPVKLTLSMARLSPRDLRWLDWQVLGAAVFTFVLALVIGFRRPQDPVARIGAWMLAAIAIDMVGGGYGWAAIWRNQPGALGLFLWPTIISSGLGGGICITFAFMFPQKLVRNYLVWILAWLPAAFVASLNSLISFQVIYRPRQILTALDSINAITIIQRIDLCYLIATVPLLGIQYRRLKDVNERRRMRVLFAGLLVSCLAYSTMIVLSLFAPAWYTDHIFAAIFALYTAAPVALAYAVLRHRVFDLGVIVRRGLQYALARRALVSAVPILAAIFVADLLLHGDQPILTVFRARGWVYAVLAALAAVAYTKRQSWLETLDRRFFREQYDARRLLCEVVEEVRVARSFEQEAPRVTTRIESALHPEFVALLVSEPQEKFYRILAASPERTGPPPLQKESKLLSLMRLLGKPLEVTQTGTGWLQQQLPHEETEYLRRGRIDLLVPVATDPQRTEVLLVLGAKRSEEPYSGEDQDLLVAIAASLAILIERPATGAVPQRTDIFEECPQCGSCYDSGSSQCGQEGARLVPVVLPRLLEGRYRLERRLGRGGMGTVYAASVVARTPRGSEGHTRRSRRQRRSG
jgi:hypothetical protein